jgi:Tol biopolymer transport system component
MSDDGRFVAFNTTRNNLDSAVTGAAGGVYLRDLITGVTTMISRNLTSGNPANVFNGLSAVVVSPDGRFVVFGSAADNLIDGVTIPAGQENLFLFDRQSRALRLLTLNIAGVRSGNSATRGNEFQPAFSADSRRLVFVSRSSDLVAGVTDTNNALDVFVTDLTGRAALATRLVSQSTTPGAAGNAESGTGGVTGFGPSISQEGRFVVFGSRASNLVPESNARQAQVYIRDLETGTTRLVSLNRTGTSGAMALHSTHLLAPMASASCSKAAPPT